MNTPHLPAALPSKRDSTAVAMPLEQRGQLSVRRMARLRSVEHQLKTSSGLSEEQVTVIRTELTSPPVRSLDDDALHDVLVDIWSEVKLLTGCIMHQAGPMLDLQKHVLQRFIRTSKEFSDLTPHEIKNAFYLNDQGLLGEPFKHWNKELNGEFLGSVLRAYCVYKRKLYDAAGKQIRALLDAEDAEGVEFRPAIILSIQTLREEVEADYERFLTQQTAWIFNTRLKYCFLRQLGMIAMPDRRFWSEIYIAAAGRRREIGNRPPLDTSERLESEEVRRIYRKIDETGIVPREEHHRIVNEIRHFAYLSFFRSMAAAGIKNFFDRVKWPPSAWPIQNRSRRIALEKQRAIDHKAKP